MKFIKNLLPIKIKLLLRKTLNLLVPGESLSSSKNKWNKLASKNSLYFVMTDLGENITEADFKKTGEKDFKELIENDEFIKSRLGNFSEKIVLEIGCGAGRITEFLSQNFKKVFAVDISEKMITDGQERLKNASNIEFSTINGTRYHNINDSTIDFVFSYIVFQHMPNKKVVIENFKEILRVLKNDGIAKIQVRGLPTNKLNWFYGPSFTKKDIENIAKKINMKILKTDGENQRYFWVWFSKQY